MAMVWLGARTPPRVCAFFAEHGRSLQPWRVGTKQDAVSVNRMVAVASARRSSPRKSKRKMTSRRQKPKEVGEPLEVKLQEPDSEDWEDEEEEFDSQADMQLQNLFTQLEANSQADGYGANAELVSEELAVADGAVERSVKNERLRKIADVMESAENERSSKRIVKLEISQLKKLREALDCPKKDLKIKELVQETGLQRKDVLSFLRSPPLHLIDFMDSVPEDEDEEEELAEDDEDSDDEEDEEEEEKSVPEKVFRLGTEGEARGQGPKAWYAQKRIKKKHIQLFERVYEGYKYPAPDLMKQMVHLSHVPWRRIEEWFDYRRKQDAELQAKCTLEYPEEQEPLTEDGDYDDTENMMRFRRSMKNGTSNMKYKMRF